jgi:tetratricopeptide (TPR) repeat protein
MDQLHSTSTNNDIFNRQQSIYDSEALVAVWLQTQPTTTNKNFDFIKSKIENNVDLLRNFIDDPKGCVDYIHARPKNVKIFFILSNKYVSALLKDIHDSQVIHTIYIHDEVFNEEDMNKYSKVINVYKNLHLLVDDLSATVYTYSRYMQLPITIFKQRDEQDQTTNLLNKFAYFVDFWNPLFIDLLFDLPQRDYCEQKVEFIEQCRIRYRADETVLKVIDEFENTYKPEFSILWYKRDSFVYRLLNKVMRQQNIKGILMFHFFIFDLFKQLNQIYHKFIDDNVYEDDSNENIYRGQFMLTDELDNLRKYLTHGTIISINSFFSTTRDKNVALDFAGVTDTDDSKITLQENQKRVLFEIDVKYDHKMQLKRKPFADVSYLSDREKFWELEVIFMVGSFFQVDEIVPDVEFGIMKEKVTVIKLTLINEDDSDISVMKDYQILKSTKTTEGKVIRIGNLLIDRSLSIQSPRSKADPYYQALYSETKLRMTGACLTGQAWVALKREQYDLATKLALEALSIDDHSNDELTITILNCLGGVYSKLKDYPKALKYYTQAYGLSKPTEEQIENKSYKGPCIPIDKHAMYDNYRNISSINKACIHQKTGAVQLAWNTYKEAVDCEMRDTTDFHCHICMTIAESGTHERTADRKEQVRLWNNWKCFLDLGLVDMLKYRTPAVTGYLSYVHQYDFPSRRYNNSYCRELAIDYFGKVEKLCEPYVSNRQYGLYTLQCYERLAELYQHWNSRATDYYEKMIKLCLKHHPDDLENITIGYKGMMDTYKQQQLKTSDNSEDISSLLCTDEDHIGVQPMTPPVTLLTPPLTPLIPPMFGTLFQNMKPLHFAFGCYEKWIDPRLKNVTDLRKKVIYCHMKLAALYYDQKRTEDAKHSLLEAILLCRQFDSEMHTASIVCEENLAYIDQDFDSIIQSYINRLLPANSIVGDCIDENNYCYIAQLYEKKNDFHSACKYLQKPIEYFERYNYICLHTIDCYLKLAKHYQAIQNDKKLTIHTYERIILLLKKHRSNRMVKIISIFEDHLISCFKKINDLDAIIIIYNSLCKIIQVEITDIPVLYNRLERVITSLKDKYNVYAVLNAYDAFLDFSLQEIDPLTPQMNLVLTHFRDHSIKVYQQINDSSAAIEIYQKLICLLFKHQTDMRTIIIEYKGVAAGFKEKNLVEDSITAYENLLSFACQHHSTGGFIEGDLIAFVFCVWKDRIIEEYLDGNKFDLAISLYYKMIHFLKDYREHINPTYSLVEFISEIKQNYDRIAIIHQLKKNDLEQTIDTYQEQIDFLAKYEVQSVQKQINTIFSQCQRFATDHAEQACELYLKLVYFIEKNRLHYLSDLSNAYEELAQLGYIVGKLQQSFKTNTDNYFLNPHRVAHLNQSISQYRQKAKNYLKDNRLDKAIAVYKSELLPFLLESHAQDDEQIAICYGQMASLFYKQNEGNVEKALDYYQKAIDIYEKQKDNFYTDYAFELNENVCRRYAGTLFTCYHSKMTIYISLNDSIAATTCEQQMINIYEKHKDQFQFIHNPQMNVNMIVLRPFVELNY